MFSDLRRTDEKGFPWHWHWVNKALCYPFCRTALVGGVHILQWGLVTWACQNQSLGWWEKMIAKHFVFWLQQLLLHFYPQFAILQIFNSWISSNSFFTFNSHSLKLRAGKPIFCIKKVLRKLSFPDRRNWNGIIPRKGHFWGSKKIRR